MELLELFTYIDKTINTKTGTDKIQASEHNAVLHELVNSLIEIIGTGFGGSIAPSNNPGTQTNPIFFLASEVGTYTYCAGLEVTALPAFVIWNGSSWKLNQIGVAAEETSGTGLKGIATAGDPEPSSPSVGDWYIYIGSSTLNWPSQNGINKPGVVILDSATTTNNWVSIPFDNFTIDSSPTSNSTNLVTSGGVAAALSNKVDKVEGKGLSTEDYTTAEKEKLAALNEHNQGTYTSLEALQTAIPEGSAGDEAVIDAGIGTDAQKAIWDTTDGKWVIAGGGAIEVDSTPTANSTNAVSSGGVKTALEGKADKVTNATEDNLPSLDSEGNLKDSGIAADTVLNTSNVDVSEIEVGEKMLMTVEKTEDETAIVGDAVKLLDKLAGSPLDTLLAEDQAWDGDEITLSGDNLTGGLGENSQEYYIGSDFFLCISHSIGTTTTDGWAIWRRNRGQDALNPDLTQDAAIIAELTDENANWTIAGYITVTTKSKMGTWYRSITGGWLYMCIDASNGWTRVGEPDSVDMEITSTSHPTLTTNLAAYDFATNGLYDESTDTDNETAYQGQEWWDEDNGAVYKRNMNGYWAKIF